MAPHSSTLAWKIPWMEEPGGLQSMGSLRVRHKSDFTFTFMHWRRKWQPTPVFLPAESQGRRSLVGCHLWGRTESDTTEVTQQQQQTITTPFPVTETAKFEYGEQGDDCRGYYHLPTIPTGCYVLQPRLWNPLGYASRLPSPHSVQSWDAPHGLGWQPPLEV